MPQMTQFESYHFLAEVNFNSRHHIDAKEFKEIKLATNKRKKRTIHHHKLFKYCKGTFTCSFQKYI